MARENSTMVYYSVPDAGGDERYSVEVFGIYDISDEMDRKMLMQDAAEDFHHNRYGVECSWPLVFALHETEEGPEVARYSIERETVPSFMVVRC